MDRKLKNTLLLSIILVLMVAALGVFIFVFQSGTIEELSAKKTELKEYTISNNMDTLRAAMKKTRRLAAALDSSLSMRKYNIPQNITETRFYDFVNKISFHFSKFSFVNVVYGNEHPSGEFLHHKYSLQGTATFNDLYKLIYAIEQSKELKKVTDLRLSDVVMADDEGIARYLVSFKFKVESYFSETDRFVSSLSKENRLTPNPIYDVFYPLIRNEIPPNLDGLLDVQTAQLLALIPDGAFLSDASGNTFLLWEGDKVYLGYLTKIDYDRNEVHFVLNKGGLIEKEVLTLDEKKAENIK